MRERKRITYKEGENCKYVPILGIGHPRTGTGYTSKILRKWGLDVLHENIGKDGIVSWFLVFETGPFLWQNQFSHRPAYDHLIYNVRNPRESLASIVYTETPHTIHSNFEKQGDTFVVNTSPRQRLDFISHRWRSARIHGMEQKNPIESAIVSICAFNDMINYLKPDVTYRIEDQDKLLYEYLEKHYDDITYVEHRKAENTRNHSPFEEMLYDFGPPRDQYIDKINEFCFEHGYKEIKFK
jgi:hypothetical protein